MKIFGLVLSLLYVCGATNLRGAEAPVKKEGSQQHSLWKIQGKTNAVYLLGSVHVLSKSSYPLPQPIESAYSNSSTLVFEADIAEMKDPNNAMKLLSKATLPEGKDPCDFLARTPGACKLLLRNGGGMSENGLISRSGLHFASVS